MFESGGNDFQSCFVQIFTKHSIEPLTEYKFLHTPIFWKFFFSGTEARTNILTISDLAWQSVSYIFNHFELLAKSYLSSNLKLWFRHESLMKSCEKKTIEFNTSRTGLNCWSCSETLHFTFSQPFNNLLCYFFGGGSIINDRDLPVEQLSLAHLPVFQWLIKSLAGCL